MEILVVLPPGPLRHIVIIKNAGKGESIISQNVSMLRVSWQEEV